MKNKFILLNQNDSVYKNWWVEISIDRDCWNEWESFCINNRMASSNWLENTTGIETRWDLDECRECQIISPEHLCEYFKWVTTKK